MNRFGTVMVHSIEDLKRKVTKRLLHTFLSDENVQTGVEREANPSLKLNQEIKQSNDVDLHRVLSNPSPTIPQDGTLFQEIGQQLLDVKDQRNLFGSKEEESRGMLDDIDNEGQTMPQYEFDS